MTKKVEAKQQELNPRLLDWPSDPSGRLSPLKEAIVNCSSVQNKDIEATLVEALKLAVDWLPARAEANRAAAKAKEDKKLARIEEAKKVAAQKKIEGARADKARLIAAAKDAAKRLEELEKTAGGK